MSIKHEHHKTYLMLVNSEPDQDRVRVTLPAAGRCSSSAIILHRIRHCQLLPSAVAQVALLVRADLRLRGQTHMGGLPCSMPVAARSHHAVHDWLRWIRASVLKAPLPRYPFSRSCAIMAPLVDGSPGLGSGASPIALELRELVQCKR